MNSSPSLSRNTSPRDEDDDDSFFSRGRLGDQQQIRGAHSGTSFTKFSDQALGSLLSTRSHLNGQPQAMPSEVFALMSPNEAVANSGPEDILSPGTRFRRQAHQSAPGVLMTVGDQAPRLPRRSSDPNLSPVGMTQPSVFRRCLSSNILNRLNFTPSKLKFIRQRNSDPGPETIEGSVLHCNLSDDDGVHSDLTKDQEDSMDSSSEEGSFYKKKAPLTPFKKSFRQMIPPSPDDMHPLRAAKLTRTARSKSPRDRFNKGRFSRSRPENSKSGEKKRAKSWQELTSKKLISDFQASRPIRKGMKREDFIGKKSAAEKSERRWSVDEAIKDIAFEEMLKTPIRSNKAVLDPDTPGSSEKEESPVSVEKVASVERSGHSRVSKSSHKRRAKSRSRHDRSAPAEEMLLAVEELSLGESNKKAAPP